MKTKVLVLGGYGGVGKSMSENLLRFTDVELIIAGRSIEKATRVMNSLLKKWPNRQVKAVFADVSDKPSLLNAFKNIDVVIVTTTTADKMEAIGKAALEAGCDMIDILVRGDVVDQLENLERRIVSKQRIFITQAGFHPGLPAPFIKYPKDQFDVYSTANVVMAMNSLFEKPGSTHEIIYEIVAPNSKTLEEGIWKNSSYKDAVTIQFSDDFGVRKCYPVQMREILPLKEQLGLTNMGVYAAGFNVFVDRFVFPLAMFLSFIDQRLAIKICGKLMHWGIKKYYNRKPGVEFKLFATGLKNGKKKKYTLEAHSSDVFDFTACAVIACLRQYLDHSINRPGLYTMGNSVDEKRIISDLKEMGIRMTESISSDSN